jgi:hypothetical protein
MISRSNGLRFLAISLTASAALLAQAHIASASLSEVHDSQTTTELSASTGQGANAAIDENEAGSDLTGRSMHVVRAVQKTVTQTQQAVLVRPVPVLRATNTVIFRGPGRLFGGRFH